MSDYIGQQQKIEVSIVVACYNEELLLAESIRQLIEVMDATRYSYEIIFVDDCSRDATRKVIDEIIQAYPDKNFQKIFHTANTGRGRAVSDGFRAACGEVVGYIDIDLEVHARYIPSCVLAIKKGADLVIAHRIYTFSFHYVGRYILSKGYIWLVRFLLRVPFRDTEAGFKFFRRAALLKVLDEVQDEGWFWDTEIMVRFYINGLKCAEIPCLFLKRFDKKSSVRVFKDTYRYFFSLVKFWRQLRLLN